ncbi:MAG: radical SAM protein [Bacteroidales bacterium]|jgi:oxygen-independent coproporphyrinogen-3 oxidase
MSIPEVYKKWFLKQFLGSGDTMTFRKYTNEPLDLDGVDNIYIHVPFCRNKCPYCPYFKELYHEQQAGYVGDSLLREIEMHAGWLQGKEIQSLYIGGGTPTLLNSHLIRAIDRLRGLCTLQNVALETTPQEINNRVTVELGRMGCNMISLGIQDFNPKYLDFLGRKYTVPDVFRAIDKLEQLNFRNFNIDLIFAMPGQTLEELDHTLQIAADTGADQLTLYPLFTFPYSVIGKSRELSHVVMPDGKTRKQMYFHIQDTLIAKGYKQVSVWSFLKGNTLKYSSVTRDKYLGLGPSAGTYTGKQFLFNTFNINEYIPLTIRDQIPGSYIMDVSPRLERLFWIYWRLYETKIPLNNYKTLFGSDFMKDYGKWVRITEQLGYAFRKEDQIELTKKGIHRIHLLQNHFALEYINRIWTASTMEHPPEEIHLSSLH